MPKVSLRMASASRESVFGTDQHGTEKSPVRPHRGPVDHHGQADAAYGREPAVRRIGPPSADAGRCPAMVNLPGHLSEAGKSAEIVNPEQQVSSCQRVVAMTDRSDRWARCLAASRPIARYTVDRATPNRSPSSAVLYSPDFNRTTRCALWRGLSLGCLPRSRPLALAILMPSLVRSRMRSASNSATMPA